MKKLFLLLVFIIPQLAFSWGDIGHATTGEIAERHISKKTKAWLQTLVGVDPLFYVASFPDQMKYDLRYEKFTAFHFIEIPVGSTFSNMPNDLRMEYNAHSILDQCPDLITKKSTPKALKSLLLKYLIHIVGDVHQPLHIGNYLDRGGNLCYVKVDEKAQSQTLHSVWDDTAIEKLEVEYRKFKGLNEKAKLYFGHKELAEMLLTEIPKPEEAKIMDPLVWYAEAQKLHAVAYVGDTSPADRPYCKLADFKTGKISNGKYNVKAQPILGQAYMDQVTTVIKQRVVLAGFRLANLLNAMAEKAESEEEDGKEYSFEEILSAAMLKDRTLSQ